MGKSYFVAIDLGGTSAKGGVFNLESELLSENKVKTLSKAVELSVFASYYVNKFSAGFDSVLLFESVSYGIFTTTDR